MHFSDSSVQQNAEKIILSLLEKKLRLESNTIVQTRISLNDTFVEFDGFNEEKGIIAEVYAHIGKLKSAQSSKPINDIMKMLLIEKCLNRKLRKISVVCDDNVLTQLQGKSWKAIALEEFDIEVIKVDIEFDLRNQILEAQKRQYR